MLSKMNLRTKFSLFLSLVFLSGIVIAGLILWQVLQRRVEEAVTAQGVLIIEAMNAVRTYTSDYVRPLLIEDLYTEPEFIRETVPAYSARTVFTALNDNLKGIDSSSEIKDVFYKEAALNPTNLCDLVDGFEYELLMQMRADPEVDEVSGFRFLEGRRLFYIARPLSIKSEKCLECHTSPEVAPKSLMTSYYGPDSNEQLRPECLENLAMSPVKIADNELPHGFGWQVGETVAAQMIYVPAQEIYQATQRSFLLIMGIFLLMFVGALVILNFFLRMYVIEPVIVLGAVSQKISNDELTEADLEEADMQKITVRQDELGHLAQMVRKMAQEVRDRTQKLKAEIQVLRIEVDKQKQKEQVDEIVETDFFRDLQSKAQDVRRQRKERKKRNPRLPIDRLEDEDE